MSHRFAPAHERSCGEGSLIVYDIELYFGEGRVRVPVIDAVEPLRGPF